MRLLCVLNGPYLGTPTGRQRLVNRRTARFLLELARLVGELTAASSLVDEEQGWNLSDFDLEAHREIRVSGRRWEVDSVWSRARAYPRALPWVLREARRADALYVFLPSHMGRLFVAAAWLLGRPYGVYLNGSKGIDSGLTRRALARARFVLATSDALASRAAATGVRSEPVTPMIEVRRDQIVAEAQIRTTPPFRILYVGRIEEAKGVRELLEAAGELKRRGTELQVDLVGPNPERDRFRALAEQHGIAEADFHGLVSSPEELADHYRRADLFVIPSHHEGFPRVLYEAMAHGTPIATTFVGGIRSIMRDGENCVRVPLRDAAGLADALEEVLRDAGLRRRIAEGGLATLRALLDERRPSHAAQVAWWIDQTIAP